MLPILEKECKCCGDVFRTRGTKAKFCPDCREFMKKKRDSEEYAVEFARLQAVERANKSAEKIKRINAEARAHGMSYGQWVAANAGK